MEQVNKTRIIKLTGRQLKTSKNLPNLTNTIYKNFLGLSSYPVLKHTKQEITRLLTSPNMIMYMAINNKQVIGYLTSEIIRLDDGRMSQFISYLYVQSAYRSKSLGSALLNCLLSESNKLNLNTIMLVTDTADKPVLNFYMAKGFMYDLHLRRYDRYDVLSLPISEHQ